MQRRGGQQQTAVVVHEKLAQRRDVLLFLDLAREQFAEIFQHHQHGAPAFAVLAADGRHERIDDRGIVFHRAQTLVQLPPRRLVRQYIRQNLAKAEQEIRKRQRAVRFFREAGDCVMRGEVCGGRDFILDQREQMSLADAARPDKKKMMLGLARHRPAQQFQGVLHQRSARDGDMPPVRRRGQARPIKTEVRSGFRHSIFSTML